MQIKNKEKEKEKEEFPFGSQFEGIVSVVEGKAWCRSVNGW